MSSQWLRLDKHRCGQAAEESNVVRCCNASLSQSDCNGRSRSDVRVRIALTLAFTVLGDRGPHALLICASLSLNHSTCVSRFSNHRMILFSLLHLSFD